MPKPRPLWNVRVAVPANPRDGQVGPARASP